MNISRKTSSFLIQLSKSGVDEDGEWIFTLDIFEGADGMFFFKCYRKNQFKMQPSFGNANHELFDEDIFSVDYMIDDDSLKFPSEVEAKDFVVNKLKGIFGI